MVLTHNVRKQSLAHGSQVLRGTGRRDKFTRKLVVTLICGKLPFQFLLHPGLIDPVVDKWHDFSFWCWMTVVPDAESGTAVNAS
jgi:hypothetical protein